MPRALRLRTGLPWVFPQALPCPRQRAMMSPDFLRAAFIAASLSLAACTTAPSDPAVWSLATSVLPTLAFGSADSDSFSHRLSCNADGTRLVTWVRGLPRGTAADSAPFPTRMRVFLGRTELDLGATATPTPGALTMVEAAVPDPSAFFTALKANGRLVTVTFAGRTMAPVPAAGLVDSFQQQCAGIARTG